jgi:putative membrane protein
MMFFRGFNGCIGNGFGFMHSGWGAIIMGIAVIGTILLVFAILAMIKKRHEGSSSFGNGDSVALLNERYVRGEISDEAYISMKRTLKTK